MKANNQEILRPSLFLLEGTKILVVAKKAVKEIDFSEKGTIAEANQEN